MPFTSSMSMLRWSKIASWWTSLGSLDGWGATTLTSNPCSSTRRNMSETSSRKFMPSLYKITLESSSWALVTSTTTWSCPCWGTHSSWTSQSCSWDAARSSSSWKAPSSPPFYSTTWCQSRDTGIWCTTMGTRTRGLPTGWAHWSSKWMPFRLPVICTCGIRKGLFVISTSRRGRKLIIIWRGGGSGIVSIMRDAWRRKKIV